MRATWLMAGLLALSTASAVSAQTTTGTGTAAVSPNEGAATTPPRRSLARMATSHTEIAKRLAGRADAAGPTKPDPRVAAAAKAADEAIVDDPTVRAMLNPAMAKPPSLAGGAPPIPAPVPAPPR